MWGGFGLSFAGPSGELTSAYSPSLLLDGSYISSATQTLVFDTSTAPGFEAGVNFFPAPHVGIQVLVDRTSADLSGVNGPYDVSLQYVSTPPPFYTPVPVTLQTSTPWPDTSGSLAQWTFAINAVARVGNPGRVSATFSGGLSNYLLSGSIQPLAYTTFHLGGHSVLFEDDYRLAVEMERAHAFGWNAGADVNVPLGGHVALLVGYRYLGGPTADVSVHPSEVLNPSEVFFQQTLDEITRQLALAPVRVSPSGSRLIVGLKFTP